MHRETVAPDHPIFTARYAIFTPPMDEMVSQIGLWIEQKISGGYVHGPSQFGKSRAVQFYLAGMLKERFGVEVPLIIWVRQFPIRTPAPFYSELLRAAGQPYWKDRGTPSRKQQLCMDFLIAGAMKARTNYMTILIDEAQTMTDTEWQYLMGLQNLLDQAGYRLSIISVGSHQMEYVHGIQALTGNAHIAARFLLHSARFHGVTSQEQCEFVLVGYDEDSEWPVGSGISYTKAFAAKYFATGRRLAHHSEIFWSSFIAQLDPNYNGPHEFPMKHIALTVETVLKKILAGEDWDEVLDGISLQRIINDTGFRRHMQNVSTLLPRKKRT